MALLQYTTDHETFRDRLHWFCMQEVIPFVDQWEKDHLVLKSVWQKMGREGFLCTAVEEGDEVVINGSKTFISNGINCGLVIIAAKGAAAAVPHKSLSLYLVEDGMPGFKRGVQLEKMGMHSQDTAELFLSIAGTNEIMKRIISQSMGF